ncbi:kinase-like protein [Periconia macrospinosa]|uniref:Kinase-like protein n=1 Tax=Periconia macrospinosa TaxID=97972 RepID=A0A2V1E7G1_9PLEO|nr:kinase-like protein [Periconia macrospinosa]
MQEPEAEPDYEEGIRFLNDLRWEDDFQVFLNDELRRYNQNGEWEYEEILQNSGERMVCVYVDDDGNLRKKMAVKVEIKWNETDLKSNIAEYEAHKKISDLGSPHIVVCHGWGTTKRPSGEYLLIGYMEYLSGGDLLHLIDRYQTEEKQVPEGLIWIIFRAVAEAIFAWSNGYSLKFNELGMDGPNTSAPGWTKFINFDLKPENICLGMPREGFEAFPTPKVIDFGHLVPFDRRVYMAVQGSGTDGWISPEVSNCEEEYEEIMERPDAEAMLPDFRRRYVSEIDVGIQIFGLGLVVLNLMSLPGRDMITWKLRDPQPRFCRLGHFYTGMLIYLVHQCLSLSPGDRIRLPDLLKKTKEGFEGWERATIPMRNKTKAELGPIANFIMPDAWEYEYGVKFGNRDEGEARARGSTSPRRNTSPRGGGTDDPGDDNDNDNNDQGGRRLRDEAQQPTASEERQDRDNIIEHVRTFIDRNPQLPYHRLLEVFQNGLNEVANDADQSDQHVTQDQGQQQTVQQQQDQQQQGPSFASNQRQGDKAKGKNKKARGKKADAKTVEKTGAKKGVKTGRVMKGRRKGQDQNSQPPPADHRPRSLRKKRAGAGDYKKFM